MFCPKCGKEIVQGSNSCSSCGNPIGAAQIIAPPPPPFPTQNSAKKIDNPNEDATKARPPDLYTLQQAPVAGFFIGLLGGAIGGSICFVLGGFLSAIGIALVGIPMMIIGGIIPVAAPIVGFFFASKAFCPYCKAAVLTLKFFSSDKCRTCKNQIIIRDNNLYKIGL
jgi:hypothetical protein